MSTTVLLDGGGGEETSGGLRLDVRRMISEKFTQSPLQERMARRAALLLQTMGDNNKPAAAELSAHLQQHLITVTCLRRATNANDATRDALVKTLKDTVLNTPTRQAHYAAYQDAGKTLKLKLATDNDCARLELQAP